MSTQTEVRAYKVCLDPTPDQQAAYESHAGANRAAYNFALAAKMAAHRDWLDQVALATYEPTADPDPEKALAAARRSVKVRVPTYMDNVKAFKADPAHAWSDEVNRYALSSGMQSADRAWKNWIDSFRGVRAGRRVGYPRFRARGRSRESFTLYHDRKQPTLRPVGYRRLNLPAKVGGPVRLHDNLRLLSRKLADGRAEITSVTISRQADRWYASVLCHEQMDVPEGPTRAARANGDIGVHLGVRYLAMLSDGTVVDNPKHLEQSLRRLTRAQQALSRTRWIRESDGAVVKTQDRLRGVRYLPTEGRTKAREKVARMHARVARERAGAIHELTKDLSTRYATVAVQDLAIQAMSASARGTVDEPGQDVELQAMFNRLLVGSALGEVRRQLDYKGRWYGAGVVVVDRTEPVNQACHSCGTWHGEVVPSDRWFDCPGCGLHVERELNAARNILTSARAQAA